MTEQHRITILDKEIAEKIAAGEVIERPLSIVKELVENSIDAGAHSITVEIKHGGKDYIRVTDDGSGIRSEEVKTAFQRHGTSKVKSEDDLLAIGTLGFRGEALTSIAAVSKTELTTKTDEEKAGTRIVIEGGEIVEQKSIGTPKGTTVVVRALFYNTPARLKFMKRDAAESSPIIDFVSQMALAYPNIKFRMKNNDKFLFSTQGKGDRLNAIITLSSKEYSQNLITIDTTTDSEEIKDISLEAYVSGSGETFTTKRGQVFFVNGRAVNSNVMSRGVNDAYSGRVPAGRYPAAYIFLRMDASKVDVNIHPNKREIKFYDEREVYDFIKKSIDEVLKSKEALPNIFADIPPRPPQTKPFKKAPDISTEKRKEAEIKEISEEQADVKSILKGFREESSKVAEEISAYKADIYDDAESNNEAIAIKDLQCTEILFGTYLLAKDEEYLYLIDQHAAHERVLYEKILHSFESEETLRQKIMVPITFDSFREDNEELSKLLDKMGFSIEDFGPGTYCVREIPMYFSLEEAKLFLNDFMASIEEEGDFIDNETAAKVASRACKAAIKANDIIGEEEVKRLLEDLSECKNPFSCPHGRPTLIKMSKSDIEKRFKRI